MTSYPTNMTLRPITAWPHQLTQERRRSNFSAQWGDTLGLLDRELWYLGNGQRNAPAILQIAMREQDFRIDGMPRATAKPEHPGVILNVESRTGPLSFPCDTFTSWQDNLRAIALALEALRRLDRYGITPRSEQYAGWKQLPSAGEQAPAGVTADEAERQLRLAAGDMDSPLDRVYRAARAGAHPDRNGGDRSGWDAAEEAAAVLRAHGRLRDER